MHWAVWESALPCCGWLKRLTMYLLLLLLSEWTVFSIARNMCSKDLDEQYTLDIVFSFHFNVSFVNVQHFLPCMVYKTKIPLTVFHCHIILIENVCRLLCEWMLPTIIIKMCVKLKHIHLVSYVEVEKLTSKVNEPYHKHTSCVKSP